MACPKCGSANISNQTFQEAQTNTVSFTKSKYKEKGHGCLWWLFIGWWWWIVDLFCWIVLFPIRAIIALTKKKKYKGKSVTTSTTRTDYTYRIVSTCNECGHTWTKIE